MADTASIHMFPVGGRQGSAHPATASTYFTRDELTKILNIYGRQVAKGNWKDYALDMGGKIAVFSIHRRASEAPLYQIVKDPALRRKQGTWRITAMDGRIMKRGHSLDALLVFFGV